MTVKGIDVSSYQSESYDTSGLAFVIVKRTEGVGYVNPKASAQVAHGRAAGLVIGHYHYPHIHDGAVADADYFLSHLGSDLHTGDIIALDWEWYGQSGVTNAEADDFKDAWLARVKSRAPGHKVIVYCDRNSWLNVDTNSNAGDGLWIADYVTAGQPRIKAKWLFHQYTDAAPQGGDGNVAAFADKAALTAWAAGTTPQEDDMTPDQAQQLDDLHSMMTSIKSLTEKDAKGNPAVHGAGYYLAHIHFDALKIVASEAAQTAAITAMATALGKVDAAVDVPALVSQVQQAVDQGVTKALNGITIDVNATSTTS